MSPREIKSCGEGFRCFLGNDNEAIAEFLEGRNEKSLFLAYVATSPGEYWPAKTPVQATRELQIQIRKTLVTNGSPIARGCRCPRHFDFNCVHDLRRAKFVTYTKEGSGVDSSCRRTMWMVTPARAMMSQ